MKRLLLLSLTISIHACQQPHKESEEKETTSTEIVEEPVFIDSVIFEPDSASNTSEEIKPVFKEVSIPNDTKGDRILIDRVYVFENGEPYVWVGLKEGYDWRAMDSLKRHADSVIFQGEYDVKRTRYPWNKANQYMNLELLDGITIFNYQHENLGQTTLQRIEYFEDVLGDGFVAVLNPNQELVGDQFYGINGVTEFIETLQSVEKNYDSLDQQIKDHIGIRPKYQLGLSSTLVYPYNIIFTSYTFATQNDIEKSFLIETNESYDNRVVSEITNDFSIRELIPVPIQLNNMPLLLLWVGPPETDIEWHTPAVFNGAFYEIPNSRIIELKHFSYRSRVDNDSIQCSGEVLHNTYRNIDSLDSTLVHDFLRTFDEDCRKNAEYSEWSNEILFEILNKNSAILVSTLSNSDINIGVILEEIESPLTDKYLPSELMTKVNELPVSPIRDGILSSLRTAQSNYE